MVFIVTIIPIPTLQIDIKNIIKVIGNVYSTNKLRIQIVILTISLNSYKISIVDRSIIFNKHVRKQ